MIGNSGRPLLQKRGALPPTATTSMLESMLDQKKKKQPKKRRHTTKNFFQDIRVSNSQPEICRIMPTGGLEDAPTFVQKEALLTVKRYREQKQVKDEKSVASTKLNEGKKRVLASANATSMPLTLTIGRVRKRARDRFPVPTPSVPFVVGPAAAAKPQVLSSTFDEPRVKDQVLTSFTVDSAQQPFREQPSLQQSSKEQLPASEERLSSGKSDIAQYAARDFQVRLDEQKSNVGTFGGASKKGPAKAKVNNDNFVRLNLKNSAGACRGARNKKKRFRQKNQDTTILVQNGVSQAKGFARKNFIVQSGVDPLDDFLDGVYLTPKDSSSSKVPQCARHQRPCKLLTVKKNTTGNKGRKFYVCSLPRGEQCEYFEWADNTVEAAQRALLRTSSFSGFVARQVAAYSERFQSLTVPELRDEAKRRSLVSTGKRKQLLIRLSLWVRDEVVRAGGEKDGLAECTKEELEAVVQDEDSESDDSTVSSEELVICHTTLPTGDSSTSNNALTTKCCNHDDNDEHLSVTDPAQAGLPASSTDSSLSLSLFGRLQELFGYDDFRDGQEWAVKRCLEKQKTLLVAPTGFGKSLCYALPAALTDGICIVVSPLISLMQDQLRQLPPRIPAATLSGTLSAAVMASTVDDVIHDRLKILFVSPERLVSPSFQRLFQMRWNAETRKRERSFPTVSLLCVDEAHCVSQWGHNFRPSYLRLTSLLELIQPESVLAMTATACPLVVRDICNALRIPFSAESTQDAHSVGEKDTPDEIDSGVKILTYDRDNINVCCRVMSNEGERLALLVNLLRKTKKTAETMDRTSSCLEEGRLSQGSVIVYVWRQMDAEVVAENLMASGIEGGVVVYHGGMDNGTRAKAQSKFMRGKARICVATVAFGMGIDKADVAGVVHMYLPGSPENYIQEIGRAGRDGRPAMAVALVMSDEVIVRHSLAHSNMLSRSQIWALLQLLRNQVLGAVTAISDNEGVDLDVANFTASLNIVLPLESTVMATDCKTETIETLLSLLEAVDLDHPLLKIQGTMTDQATITLKKRSLEKLARVEKIAGCIQKCGTCLDSPEGVRKQERDIRGDVVHDPRTKENEFLAYSFGSHCFSITRCATLLGESAEPRHVFAALRRLQTAGELELALDASPTGRALYIQVEPAGVRYLAGPDSSLEEVANDLSRQFSLNVAAAAKKALDAKHILHRVASVGQPQPSEGNLSASLGLFQELVEAYFDGNEVNGTESTEDELPRGVQASMKREVAVDASSLLRDMKGFPNFLPSLDPVNVDLRRPEARDYTALTLAKFMHSIDTPRAPYAAFSRHPAFGKWRDVRFASLLNALEEMLNSSPVDYPQAEYAVSLVVP